MNPSDPSGRLERMKKVLADSYPRASDPHAREPLPESARVALGGKARPESRSVPFFGKLLSMLRGPQLAAIGATALLIIAAIVLVRPPAGTGTDKGQDMRSTGGTVSLPSIVVLNGLTDGQTEALKASGYFRPEQLIAVPAGEDLTAFLAANERPNLVLVDGTTGDISAPFAEENGPEAISFAAGDDDLATRILDILAELPEPDTE